MKRKEKKLCSSDSLLFRMNAFGTRIFVNSSIRYKRSAEQMISLDGQWLICFNTNKRTLVFSCARLAGDKVI